MESLRRGFILACITYMCIKTSKSAKINTPRVLLPWFENLTVNFTFEIIEGGCYTWSLSRDDIIDLEPIYDDSWGHCSRAARVSVSKSCKPPGSVIILAEEVNSGEILRGDVDIDMISSLKVVSTTWKLYLEEAPEAFEVVAYDDSGNTFSTLEGVSFTWTIENLGNNIGKDPLVTLVRWSDTDYEAPRSIAELESLGVRSYSVLLYGQAMGDVRVTVCLKDICTDFKLNVVASVVLTPAIATIAPGDTLRYRVVRARAGRLTIQDVAETLYHMNVPTSDIARLEDAISLVRGTQIGTTNVHLLSGATEVATAILKVAEPHSIKVSIRPAKLVIQSELFIIHCVVYDEDGHALTAGDEMLIRLTVEGEANVDLVRSTENGTITDAVANNAGSFTVTAKLYSVAGRSVSRRVEGKASAVAIEPLAVVPPELYVAWTDTTQEIQLRHRGGGDEAVQWSEVETADSLSTSLSPAGMLAVRGTSEIDVRVQLKDYPYVRAFGKVLVAPPELIQVSSSGHARVGKPHHLHIALTATHPTTGEYYNFHTCNCASFAVSLLEGPEPHNVTAAPWVEPFDGACCVIECAWATRGVSLLRVSRGRAGATARVLVRAAPRLVWPARAAALVGATLPVLAEGEALLPESNDPRIAELTSRDGPPPHRHPDLQLFTLSCRRKGDTRLSLISGAEERESAEFDSACAQHVARVRLEPADANNCSGGPKIWLRPGHEVTVKVTLLDALGRELLDELGPRVSWETEPNHPGIEFRAVDRLFIEHHPEYVPVPVPHKYYQLVVADEQAIGWSGTLKASIPEASASIQARVVAPLKCDPQKISVAWEGETVSNIATVSGGSGKYAVETPKGSSGSVDGGKLAAVVPGPGSYDLLVVDQCVAGDRQHVEVNIEEVLTVEVSTSRAVCVGACVPVSAILRGASRARLRAARAVQWRHDAHFSVQDGQLCGLREGAGKLRAVFGGVSSADHEVLVFPPLSVVPPRARLPPSGKLQLRHEGGPPPHLAALHYKLYEHSRAVEVSQSGLVHGLSTGTARIRLVALDISDVEMASADAEVEVIPITGIRVRAATQTLLVGSPAPLWLEAAGLGAAALAALQPAPRVAWALRDPTVARLHTTHVDDKLERSVAEGLSVRVIPLKPGVITIDVRVRNLGQAAETRSWDSTVEILAVSDIAVSVYGLPKSLETGDRLALAVGSTIRLKSLPRSAWQAFGDGSFEVSSNGELKAHSVGYGVVVAQHKDERNNIYRETTIHVEVSTPAYCTAEASGANEDGALRVVLRSSLGRELLAPDANVSAAPLTTHVRKVSDSAQGPELLISGLDSTGSFMTFKGTAGGVTVKDEVWVTGSDSQTDRIFVTGGWVVCLEGVGWAAPAGVGVHAGSGAAAAVLARPGAARHTLRRDRPAATKTLVQLPLDKMEFHQGEWPATMVPLSMEAAGLTSGPVLCSEEQKYALEGVPLELPFTCRASKPHEGKPVADLLNGQIGCSVIPAGPITQSSEIELCAEWGTHRTCTKVLLVPPVKLSASKVSLLNPPAIFTVYGDSQALKGVRLTPSPGLKIEQTSSNDEISVEVTSEASVCGLGWVTLMSRLTGQELRVEVERSCDVACGTLLGALFTLVRPFLPTLLTLAAVVVAYMYIQYRWNEKARLRLPQAPESVLPAPPPPPAPAPRRSWSRSPYAAPVYGDADSDTFSPNSTRIHSRFL
ncbi:nuclear pore membrane glycoprotein 210 [Cydia pomonella]|uniref:nuclear pore membrane glycoprotein 210 n=1 Tax=Cydia pomonella TaxID=82600 RepID=UPI002ADE94E1|nr:nuclear pore membrane glycoprotein 210 [Cydia pomonella]